MVSASRRNREALERPLDFDYAVEVCPKCGAGIGVRCTKRFGGKTVATVNPHPERLELARKIQQTRTVQRRMQ